MVVAHLIGDGQFTEKGPIYIVMASLHSEGKVT